MAEFRFDPLGPDLFKIGESPFRVRGLAYMALRAYADHKIDGGMQSVLLGLKDDPFADYYQQLFIAAGDYDASPLMHLFVALAEITSRDVGEFIFVRSRASAVQDSTGLWKPLLKSSSPTAMAERLPLAFNRYFEPCAATVQQTRSTEFLGTLRNVPESMSGLYCESTNGFVTACLELAGASNPRIESIGQDSAGALNGVPIQTCRFRARWS